MTALSTARAIDGLNLSGGVWHEVTTSGSAPAGGSAPGSGGGGY